MKHIIRLFFLLVFCGINGTIYAKKVTIHTEPSNATISIDGAEVGVGSYTVKFGRNVDFYVVKVSAPGYLTKTFRLMKSNPNKTVLYKLSPDEALQNSTGNDDSGMDMANKWFEITCSNASNNKDDIEIWKRLTGVALNYFDNFEVRDLTTGWLRSSWKSTTFTNQVVRTQLEIRTVNVNEEEKTFKVRISSEIRDITQGTHNYVKYNRVLNQYVSLIDELQTSISKEK